MKLKITFLLAIVVALFGVSAASASASTFLAAEYPVLVKGLSLNIQGFKIIGAVSVCEHASFMTGEDDAANPGGASETLLIHPTYTGCHVSVLGAKLVKATVTTTGCNYVFHAALSGKPEGTVDIECLAGKSIEIKPEITGCTISVNGNGNAGLKTVEYVNEAGGKVKVNANVTKITWKATELCGLGSTGGSEAEYKEGKINALTDVAELGTGPATADSEGFNSLGEPDALSVD